MRARRRGGGPLLAGRAAGWQQTSGRARGASSHPLTHPTHPPLSLHPPPQICDVNGVCVDAAEDEIFKLTTREGKLTVEAEVVRTETADFDAGLIFEQDPVQVRLG